MEPIHYSPIGLHAQMSNTPLRARRDGTHLEYRSVFR
jgi:hypothetical protein